ncbi:tRNA (adenosine(37)-N6)-threonylcarbamoyltransferase complex ATPase subunit type 1 TsaE [Persephonella sp.]
MVEKVFRISSLQELQEFAKRLSECLRGNELILLKGNLAAGKTTFTRFLVSAIDSDAGEEVNSPTFSVMNEYETSRYPVFHVDLYRVKKFDLTDVVGNGLVIVEWPDESLFEIEDVPVVGIEFEITGENERILRLKVKKGGYVLECFE